MKPRRAAERVEESMVVPALPCYGGPFDGSFFPVKSCPIGYKMFVVRGKQVFLYSRMDVTRLDFEVLNRASKASPKEYDLGEEYP